MASTGLSLENVQLGLARHLERATDADVDALVESVAPAAHVHVILSSSVFVAPLRAIALALAASDRVTVKPSRREPVFAEALVRELGDSCVTLGDVDVDAGEIHVYGLDATIATVRSHAKSGVIVRGHGTGMGAALVTGDFERSAAALADDVVVFDQRGCLSPRVAFVVGDAIAFGKRLFDALESRAASIPRGKLDHDELEDLARWASTVEFAGTLHRGASCAVGVMSTTAYPPSGRHVLVRPIVSASDLLTALGDDARFVVALGSNDPELARTVAPAHARVSALGEMQRPPLDGPVDRRR